mmetsp:Transcript_3491/g.8250  ORF Transcript_3491/g.8250 Transcript_3491/m.8250 type:complete len:585 (-) Transcript_3491:217-1971(-)
MPRHPKKAAGPTGGAAGRQPVSEPNALPSRLASDGDARPPRSEGRGDGSHRSSRRSSTTSCLSTIAATIIDWQTFVYINVFLACSSFSCALPTIEPYLKELGALEFWAYAVAIYSVGQFIASPIWGYLCQLYRSEHTLYASLLIGVLGGFLYATARTGVEILIARLLIGLYTGSQEACHRTIVVRCTIDEERTIAQAGVSTATVLGFLFGPALAGLFFFKPLGPVDVLSFSLRLDPFTGPGWLIVFFCFISSILVTVGLTQEQTKGIRQCQGVDPPALQENDEIGDGGSSSKDAERSLGVGAFQYHALDRKSQEGAKAQQPVEDVTQGTVLRAEEMGLCTTVMPVRFEGIGICGLVLFVNALGFSAYETITTPLVKNDFGWDLFYADMLFVAAGVVCILVFFVIRITSASVEDRYLLLCGVVFSTIGYGLMLEFFDNRLPLSRFLVGFAAVNAAMELNRSVTMSLASKILPPSSTNQGLLQGMLISCVACARIIGPMYAVWVWNATDQEKFSQGHWVFVGLFLSFALTLVVYALAFNSLIPYKEAYMVWKNKEGFTTPLLKHKDLMAGAKLEKGSYSSDGFEKR